MELRGDHCRSTASIAPSNKGQSEKPTNSSSSAKDQFCANNRHRIAGRSQFRRRAAVKPLFRDQPGYVYSLKMTLGCKASPRTRKLEAIKKRGGKSGPNDGGIDAVRLIFPWRRHPKPTNGADSLLFEARETVSDNVSRLARSQDGVVYQDGDDRVPATLEHAVSIERMATSEQPFRALGTTEATPNNNQGDNANGQDNLAERENKSNTILQTAEQRVSTQKNCASQYQGKKNYLHHLNLFENPPPPVPAVDQYILDDNITYEAIIKRGNRKSVPLSHGSFRGSFLGMEEYRGVPWDRAAGDVEDHEGNSGANGIGDVVGGDDGSDDSDGDDGVNRGGDEVLGGEEDGDDECDGSQEPEPGHNCSGLLYTDGDINQLLSFFDDIGQVKEKMTLEEMISGFRKIRREWATVNTEKSGRNVLVKAIRLMERSGMTLEDWFNFMDSSQNGRGDGKLTALELRTGFERLVTHIARRECSCRAFKCEKIATYGLPVSREIQKPKATAGEMEGGATSPTTSYSCQERDFNQHEHVSSQTASDHCMIERGANEAQSTPRESGLIDACIAACGLVDVTGRVSDGRNERQRSSTAESGAEDRAVMEVGSSYRGIADYSRHNQRWSSDPAARDCQPEIVGSSDVDSGAPEGKHQNSLGDIGGNLTEALAHYHNENVHEGEEQGLNLEVGADCTQIRDEGTEERNKSKVFAKTGGAVACRKHALEGMVYLGQRAYFQGLEEQKFTAKDIRDLMRFIDKDVNFTLDIQEIRLAIERLDGPREEGASARAAEASNLLEVLEQHMHRTGVRFTDVFFLLDKDRSGYVDKNELRLLFEMLSREPARRRAKARAKAERARERARQKVRRAAEAHEASTRLEAYKRAGVYSVLKRIQVWQARTGKRLSEAFIGGSGGGAGNVGLDVDQLTAFMRHLGLELSPSEAMLVLRHLGVEHKGLVEVKEVVIAVRNIRRYEAAVREAQKDQAKSGSGFGKRGYCGGEALSLFKRPGRDRKGHMMGSQLVRGKEWDENSNDSLGGENDLREHPRARQIEDSPSPLELLPDGPSVFHPLVEAITHGRASSAPPRGRRHTNDELTIGGRPATATAADSIIAASTNGAPAMLRGGFRASAMTGGHLSSTGVNSTMKFGRGPAWPGQKLRSAASRNAAHFGSSRREYNSLAAGSSGPTTRQQEKVGAWRSPLSAQNVGGERRPLPASSSISTLGGTRGWAEKWASSSAASAVAGEEQLPPWELGFREGYDSAGGWWPAATSAVEDGAKLEIYTGSILDGRWLNSLDSRLSKTMRATRR